MSRSNNVRGPTSALTEFLREQGISARSIVERHRRAADEGNPNQNAEAGPSTTANGTVSEDAMDIDETQPSTSNGRSPRKRLNDTGYTSDNLDDIEPQESKTAGKKRKLSKAALQKLKTEAKAKENKKKKKNDDEDYSDSEEDAYTALSKGGFTLTGKGNNVLPPVGNFENCATCEKQFTVTRYTIASNSGDGFLCNPCAKASGSDPFKKPATPRKRKDPADKRKVINFEEPERVKSLATICIEIIGKHIEDVEALGDIGSYNMDSIARVIAKNRSLTAQNSQLFYDIQNTSLTFYDATNLESDALCTLGSLNPNLQNLRLDYCGRITDDALLHWSTHLKALTRIELFGPFLIRIPGWLTFIERLGPQLKGFLITQSPRFDHECMESLVAHAPGLTELRLSEIGKLSDDWLPHIGQFSNLTSLDLSYPSISMHDEALIALLKVIGASLVHLNLSGNEELTDATLLDGILAYTKNISSLSLAHLPLITDEGITELFNSWKEKNPPLEHLNLSRIHLAQSNALLAVLTHSGNELKELFINGWKDTSNEALLKLGEQVPQLEKIDLGWCRGVDNFVIKRLLDCCQNLQEIKCYGCNRVTIDCPNKITVRILGVEGHSMN